MVDTAELPKEEKFLLLDKVFCERHPEYIHKPAKNIRDFIDNQFYLNMGSECWQTIKDLLTEFEASKKNTAVFEMPPGAGKSYLSSIITAYEIHKISCLKDPQTELGLARGSNIAVMNMSQNGLQAKKVVFGEIKARIENSFWFNKFNTLNQDKKSELDFGRGVVIIPGNSSETNPYGYNLIVVVMDEVAWWEVTKERDYVKDVYETLEKRMSNRFADKWAWKIVLITNPSYPDRYVEYLIENPKVFGVRKSIWEMKPWLFNGELVEWLKYKIPTELLIEAQANPDSFKRDMLGFPSDTLYPWLVNPNAIDKCINVNMNNPVKEGFVLYDEIVKLKHKICNVHIDLGLTGDAGGFAMTYKENGKVKVGLLLRFKGSVQSPIKFSDIRQILIALRDKGIQIAKISYDGFQSVDSLQILKAQGFEVELLSVDRSLQPYDTLKELIYDMKIELPNVNIEKAKFVPETPEEWLYKELRELEKRESKVDHKPKGSKDMSDALAGSVYWSIQSEEVNITGSENTIEGVGTLESNNIFDYK